MPSATLFCAYAFLLTATEKKMLDIVGAGVDFCSQEAAVQACRDAGATDWMIFSYPAVQVGDIWRTLALPVVVETTLPRQIE